MDTLLNNRLTELAARINGHLSDIRANILPICVDLAEARSKFADNAGFSRWLKDNAIALNHQDRAAAIAMGEDPDRLKVVLMTTTRTSIQMIYEHEFRLTSASKTKRTSRDTDEFERAAHVIERRTLAGESLAYKDIQQEAGVSSIPVRSALKAADAVAKLKAETEITLSATAQEKLDAAMRAHKKQLDLAFETAVGNEVRKRMEEMSLPAYFAELKRVEALLNSPRYAIMKVGEFKKILACLHPDNAASTEMRAEAFDLFNKYRAKLIDQRAEKDEADRLKRVSLSGQPLPRTVEEMLARKRTKGARK